MVIKLEYPIKLGDRKINELTFPERPSLRHLFAGDAYDRDTVMYDTALVASLSGESMSLLGEMDFSDWIHVQSVTNAYLENSYGGGKAKTENPSQATP